MPSARRPAVLVIEDESIVAHDIRDRVNDLGYDAFAVAASADEALARADERRPDVALVDIRIKGRTDGIKTAQLLQERFGVTVVYLTAHADDATLERAKQTRPSGYLLKPVKPAELKSALAIALFRGGESEASRAATPARGIPSLGRSKSARPPGARAVRREVEQILTSPDFDASRRSREFLKFSVEETLAGRGEDLTQSSIATRVFGRKDDFDAVVDPIVRIQAGRLRRSLERYYLLAGKEDPVRIELPRGTYVPAFLAVEKEATPEIEAARPPGAAAPAASVAADDWPVVAVSLFEPSGSASEPEAAAVQLQEELVLELGRYADVRSRRERHHDPADSPRGVRFFLGGRLWTELGDMRVSARLVDLTTGQQVWGDKYQTVGAPGWWSGSLDDIARVIAARVGSEEGVVVQHLAAERRRRRAEPVTTYGAILLSYEFFLARDPQTLAPAVEALRRVVAEEPDCGLAWTRLARLCMANYSFEVTGIATPIDQVITDAQQGVRVDSGSRRARCVLASALLIKGELGAARNEIEDALRLAPDSLVYMEIIGYLLALLGDDRGRALIVQARERNPHCLPHASFGLWFDHLRRGEIDLAYQAAVEYRDPTFYWRSVMRACCLGLLGRAEEAATEVEAILKAKENFPARGRTLLGYYLKPPDVLESVVEGLAKAGLTLE